MVPHWDDDIDGVAREIASSPETPLRVLAGPGTGKTYALKRRVMRLLEERAQPSRILAVTFTRTAADSLVSELRNLGVAGCEDIDAGTLHSFCFRLLRRAEVFSFLGRAARPLIAVAKQGTLLFEFGPLLEDLDNRDTFGNKRARVKLLRAFEAAWARQQHEDAGWAQTAADGIFEAALISWLKFHRAILIGELIPLALTYLRNNPHAPELTAYDHIVVDEYQDLNKAEQSLIDLLATNSNLVVVGDEDQSIYSFRHAHPEGVLEFPDRHATTVDKTLVDCRRCPSSVVEMANALIGCNHVGGGARPLHPLAGNPVGVVHHVQWRSLSDEALGIAAFTKQLIDSASYAPGDIMILCPRKRIGYETRNTIDAHSIPVHSYYHEEALDSIDAQEAFTALSLLRDPEDRVALRFWLGCRSNNYLAAQYARLRSQCDQNGLSPFSVLCSILSGDLPATGYANLLLRFWFLVEKLLTASALQPGEAYDYFFPASEGWSAALRDIVNQTGIEIIESIDQLHDLLTRYITQPEIPANPDFVRVMSLHKSKGLTSKVVIVSGVIEGLIPTIDEDAIGEEADRLLEEQRRLFYVAITRASNVLVLSSFAGLARTVQPVLRVPISSGRGAIGGTIASRFLREMGPRLPAAVSGAAWVARKFAAS